MIGLVTRVAGALDYLIREFSDLSAESGCTIAPWQWSEAFSAVPGELETWSESAGAFGSTPARGSLSDLLECDLLDMAGEAVAQHDRAWWLAVGA